VHVNAARTRICDLCSLSKLMLGVFIPLMLFSQIERWVYQYNGQYNSGERGNSIAYSQDGHIYVAGSSKNASWYDDFTVISLDSSGVERWVYLFHSLDSLCDRATSIVCGIDGNIYAAGQGGWDLLVASLNQDGSERWMYRSDSTISDWPEVASIIYGQDGNLYVVGINRTQGDWGDFAVFSLDTMGNERWIYRYNGALNHQDWAESIVFGADGNLYSAGRCKRKDDDDWVVISLDPNGTERWVYLYNRAPMNEVDRAHSIACGMDGNLYVAGETANDTLGGWPVYSNDFTVISLDTAGNERWVYHYNGPDMWVDAAFAIVAGLNGNVYAAGHTYKIGQDDDLMVICLNPSGDERWIYTYDGPGNYKDGANTICYGLDNNIYVAGSSSGIGTEDDCVVVCLDTCGVERWVYRHNGTENDDDRIYSSVYGSDGAVYFTGRCWDSITERDIIVISLEAATGLEEHNSLQNSFDRLEVNPNPVHQECIVKYSILRKTRINITMYDVTGRLFRELINEIQDVGIYRKTIDMTSLPQGVYFIKLYSSNQSKIQKIIFLK
jgi:hypothetical protein